MKMSYSEMKRLHAKVTGRVQGVGFRYFVLNSANQLGLTGWARNRRDGSVEVIAEGELDSLKQLVGALRKGPTSSIVRDLKTNIQEPTGEFKSFHVRPTV